MKRSINSGELHDDAIVDTEMEAPEGEKAQDMPNTGLIEGGSQRIIAGLSYRDTLQRNNPELTFNVTHNAIWEDSIRSDESGDDEPPDEEDPTCPTITLTAMEKYQLRNPWRNALIIRTFDRGIGYLQLKRRLKAKWALKGDFSLIDIACDYYVTRFTNPEDYTYVMTQGPWML
ncbi:LOW QUALITY PROTEIN: hypothetical protein Cgig2_027311 [Carnegiea gigantea]|uniref:DUF4283 domain-containing protein n=1 Tax=Carnegiea gigantea TaxID=171969 RepID=A0A9Q1GHQ4_9CARY|nr:LOW QUALITY PROTEIN: hypothetical protein Cgig2_027311 [Carnegiea gigantea]